MSAQLLSAVARPEVGRFYLVPCIKVERCARSALMDADGWVPVLGSKHRDAEHIEFPDEHYHVDWRFVGARGYRNVMATSFAPHGSVLTSDGSDPWNRGVHRASELRRIKCKREMPIFPSRQMLGTSSTRVSGTPPATRWARLERAQAVVCNKLKPGNVCPHRGIALDQFAQADGTAICPGHGLRWNLATGELMPRLAA